MRSINLSEIASISGGVVHNAEPSTAVAQCISARSSDVCRGGVFVAISGNAADGHDFVTQAFSNGAAAAVVERPGVLEGRPGVVVPNSRLVLSRLASAFNGYPSAKLAVVGITGTNGKTTTNWIIYHLLNCIGKGALRIGTLGTECMGQGAKEGALTSPDPVSLNHAMADALARGARSCVMETSSHALDQARVEDVLFDVGVFTNLTRDHLDYHKTFEAYFAAKKHLFELLVASEKPTKGAVINLDDRYGLELWRWAVSKGLRDYSFGRHEEARYRIRDVQESPEAMSITMDIRDESRSLTIEAPLIGPHNAENVVAAFATGIALGYPSSEVASAIAYTPQVPGRPERIGEGPIRVFVDYAHTPDALDRVLRAVRVSTRGDLWCVFGCGGDRDRGKRPEMGKIAAAVADHVVVTSDNPRTEDPQSIIDDILASGISAKLVEPDRRAAIEQAIRNAAQGDTIVIAGKGHESYQIIGKTSVHFSDQEEAVRVLREKI